MNIFTHERILKAMYDIVIIGGGAAGMSAAIYAGRSGAKTLVIESMSVGGQMNLTYEIDNYPGIIDAPTGTELSQIMKNHALKFDVDFTTETVKEIIDAEEDIKKSQQNDAPLRAGLHHALVPERGLHLADMSLMQQHHAKP